MSNYFRRSIMRLRGYGTCPTYCRGLSLYRRILMFSRPCILLLEKGNRAIGAFCPGKGSVKGTEIGDMMGVDYSTVSQGRKRLREKLKSDKNLSQFIQKIESGLSL